MYGNVYVNGARNIKVYWKMLHLSSNIGYVCMCLHLFLFCEFTKPSNVKRDGEENWEEFVIINIFDVIYFLNMKGTSHQNLSYKKIVEWGRQMLESIKKLNTQNKYINRPKEWNEELKTEKNFFRGRKSHFEIQIFSLIGRIYSYKFHIYAYIDFLFGLLYPTMKNSKHFIHYIFSDEFFFSSSIWIIGLKSSSFDPE